MQPFSRHWVEAQDGGDIPSYVAVAHEDCGHGQGLREGRRQLGVVAFGQWLLVGNHCRSRCQSLSQTSNGLVGQAYPGRACVGPFLMPFWDVEPRKGSRVSIGRAGRRRTNAKSRQKIIGVVARTGVVVPLPARMMRSHDPSNSGLGSLWTPTLPRSQPVCVQKRDQRLQS